MKKNPIETILGFGVLIFACLFLFLAASRVDIGKVDGYTISANFSKIGGLKVGSDVRIAGIKVGSVLSTSLDKKNYTANVYMSIIPSVRLPKDTVASISDVGIMGDKYIRLDPGKSKEILKNNDIIENAKNYKSLEDNVSEFIFLSIK